MRVHAGRARRLRSPTSSVDEALWKRGIATAAHAAAVAADTAVFQPTPTGFRLGVETGRRETQAAFFPCRPEHPRQSLAAEAYADGEEGWFSS